MTQTLLLPIRVPELGPSLGKLVTGTGRTEARFGIDAERVALTTRLMDMAGDARRLAANEERAGAVAAVNRAAWLAAWEESTEEIAGRLVAYLGAQLEAEAQAVRMPRRRRRRLAIDEAERRAIAARLGSAGVGLIPAVDAIEQWGAGVVAAGAGQREVMDRWQGALTAAARRLEAAWLELERGVDDEIGAWRAVANDVAAWRKPWWPVIAVGTVGVVIATAVGLVWGEVVGVPDWAAAVWTRLRGWWP